MKCPDTSCGFTTKDPVKFCPECGTKLAPDSEMVVICSGKSEDGSPCNSELKPSQKFCMNCGLKVDPQLFSVCQEKCEGCGKVFKGPEVFCDECGLRRKPKQNSDGNRHTKSLSEAERVSERGKMAETPKSVDENVDPQTGGRIPKTSSKQNATAPGGSISSQADVETTNMQGGSEKDQEMDKTTGPMMIIELDTDSSFSTDDNAIQVAVGDGEKEISRLDMSVDSSFRTDDSVCATSPESCSPDDIILIEDSPVAMRTGNITLIEESSGEVIQDDSSLLSNVDALKIREDSNSSNASDDRNSREEKAAKVTTKRKSDPDEDLAKRMRTDMVTVDTDSSFLTCSSEQELDTPLTSSSEIILMDNTVQDGHQNKLQSSQNKNIGDTTEPSTSKDLALSSTDENKNNNNNDNNKASLKVGSMNTAGDKDNPEDMKPSANMETEEDDQSNTPVFGAGKQWSASSEQSTENNMANRSLFDFNWNPIKSFWSNQTESGSKTNEEDKATDPKEHPLAGNADGDRDSESDCEILKSNEETDDLKDGQTERDNVKQGKSERKKQKQKENSEKEIERRRRKNQKQRTSNQQKADDSTSNRVDSTPESAGSATKPPKSASKPTASQNASESKQNENKGTKTQGRTAGKYYTVVFHVLVSPDFKFNPDEQKVVIRMDDESIGGKWTKDLELEFCRKLDDEVCEMTYKLDVPERKVRNGQKIAYKYCVKVKETKKDKGEYKYIWEDYKKEHWYGQDANRTLNIPYEWKEQETYHQFDGFIEKPQKGVINYMKSLIPGRNKALTHFDFAVETFIQHLVTADSTNRSNDLIVQLDMLRHGLWRVYGVDGKQWDSKADFMREVGPKIVASVMDSIETCKLPDKEETIEDKEQRINSVIGVILAIKRMGLVCDEPKKRNHLCKLMFIQPEQETTTCKEIEMMDKLFPDKRRVILGAIISLAQQITGTTKDPCWMYLVPWIHILSDRVTAYQKPDPNMKHDEKSGRWWAISEISQNSIDYFKGKSDDWKTPIDEQIDDLSPMFEIDYLLPRTIMAAVELSKLEQVINTGKIPFEVCLAATFFYIRKHKPRVYYGYNTISVDYESKDERTIAVCVETLQEYISNAKVFSKRKETYKEFMDFCDVEPLKILRHVTTRWLSLQKCTERILHHWPALKSYFGSHEDAEKEGRVKRTLKWLTNHEMKLYYHFLTFILGPLNEFNTLFQADSSKIGFLSSEMTRLLRKLLMKFVLARVIRELDDILMVDFKNRSNQHPDDYVAIGSVGRSYLHEIQDDIEPHTLSRFFREKTPHTKSIWEMRYKIALQLLKESSEANRNILYCNCALIVLHSISIFIHLHDDDDQKQKEALTVLNKAAEDVGNWIPKWFIYWYSDMENILFIWNSVVADENVLSEKVKKSWNEVILGKLNVNLYYKVIVESHMMTEFIQLYCRKVDSFKTVVQEILSKTAFQAITQGYQLNYSSFTQSALYRFGSLLSQLFLDEWRKAVPHRHLEDGYMILKHVITWPPFLQYLKIYSEDQDKLKLLSEDCTTAIVQAVSSVESRIAALLTGSITVECLNMIGAKDSKFSEIGGMLKQSSKELIEMGIQVRQTEMKAFEEQAELVTTLTTLCCHLPVDVKDIYATLNKQKDLQNHKVKEFCNPAEIKPNTKLKDYQPQLWAFELSADVISILPDLHECNQSSTFTALWEKLCEAKKESIKTLDDIVTEIWHPAKQSLVTIAKIIEDGTITFQVFEKEIGKIYKEDSKSMEDELLRLKVNEAIIKKRINQLFKYRQLGACVKGAKEVLKFQREFKLEGDFKQIQVIAEQDQMNMPMRAFDERVMKTCEVLKEVTTVKTKCLDAFVKCRPLVNWLRKSMEKSGLKELKVFVDLAFMSAGDDPMNIQRVQCLHAAVTGYAPLIFDLKLTAGYPELLEICRLVWKELDSDPNLPQKLIDTNRHLEWLKDIKKAHGSVEVTSLVQSDAINTSGIYTVGKKAFQNKKGSKDTVDLSSSIKLTVSEVEGKRQQRNYTYVNLQDLQSRLMLVAGKAEKGTDSVDRFTAVFDSVIRLANVNMKLCEAGCVLFKDWTARFLCDKKKPVCAVLEFGEGESVPNLKARRDKEEDLEDIVPKIAKFMESCYKDWIEHIKQKRRVYLHLNYFTIDQLVILQKELVKMGTDTNEEPSHLVYPLLSGVKHNCTPEDLLAAMTETKQQIDGDQEMNEEDEAGSMDQELSEESSENEKRAAFIQELVDAGYDEKLAIQALNHVKPDEVSDGIVWCMNHEDMEVSDSDEPEEVKPETTVTSLEKTFSAWSQSNTSIQSLISTNIQMLKGIKGSSVDSLLKDLESLWQEFLASISSNIKDYLSLEHLGMILKNLAERETIRISRKLPPSFIEGVPNLVVCPSGDVLSTALSLYMLEKDQLLPQSDEILMCTQHTTIDEVDIFWRRAIFGGGEKIHCLVNADLLDFDVSDAAERYLEQYIQETNYTDDVRYRLVVICGSDNENRSRIVASLDKYRKQALPLNTNHLREYLTEKLQMTKPVNGIKPAAFVDFNKSSVRVVKSLRAGVGKTLYKSRRESDLQRLNGNCRGVTVKTVSIPLQEKQINLHHVISRLLEHTARPGTIQTRIFHIDVAHEVQIGVDYLLFNLLVLGCLTDNTGFVWRRSWIDLYLIETLPLVIHGNNHRRDDTQYIHQMLDILPDMTCRSPQDSLDVYNGDQQHHDNDQLFDHHQFESSIFQRPYQYLSRLDQRADLKTVRPERPEGAPQTSLQTLLRHCGVQDPSWAELHHFVWFLNTQLRDFERSDFVGVVAEEDLPGFAQFVLRFLIQMSRDFSTRSLKMSEESPGLRFEVERMEVTEEGEEDQQGEATLEQYQLRRTWESSPHPYLFFNSDHISFTFLGFYIDRASGNLIDQQTNQVLERGIMQHNLYDSLVRNFVPIQENFDDLPRHEKIQRMCNVMGINMPHDPDDTYELTTDNVKKIMAIYMRFRCDIPVIIMGETGCGKTRLVKFMCGLQTPPGMEDEIQNIILMKVHGGTTNADIIRKVREAERIAERNVQIVGPHMYTVLFFDEANTTESIGLIKEIMCDKSMEGQKLSLSENLKMVAACNPYREHSAELIKKLEQAGLGYHVDAEDTVDKFGRVPMRRLVYRVQPLPQSLLPLVWDFGQLNTKVEDLYIRQMVKRYIRSGRLPNVQHLVEVVSAILTASQDYMRAQKDECSFVSLRDVDRVLSVMSWFYEQSQDGRTLYNDMDRLLCPDDESEDENDDDDFDDVEDEMDTGRVLDDITRSLVLSLGVCYHACLKTREEYREHIARHFRAPCALEGGADQIAEEINCCQYVFLKNVQLEKNIAKNMALKENVFMMVVCIELRIPLFLVGKPGSSKSLAKTIVSDAMQGNASRKILFRELKQAQMVSFQCSPLSTPDGIVGTFRQCAQFQKDKDLDTFVSIVVLDEVGLAEDSPRMPLKTLHPLLEDGCQGDEEPEPYKKVAFIGISNWALDPAKMNRGILVQREVPDQEELVNSARGICSTEEKVLKRISPLIKPMCESYLQIFDSASRNMREFFGLRDFYSLVKMVYGFAERSKQKPTWYEMLHAVKRNFGGLEEDKVDPVKFFKENLSKIVPINEKRKKNDPDCSPGGLIEACLFERNKTQGESRYLLLLTENYGSLAILQQQILSRQSDIKPITIFGSSFRSDQEYTQVCRNINKIKVCMETGNTVVLLNLENLYESLYDALNQYYVYFGGERYVDLGLGTHRVKCPVHKNFRLIVVAEKQTVYKKFPIPLINRLEKHFLNINTMLSPQQQQLAKRLEDWAKQFARQHDAGMFHRHTRSEANKTRDVNVGDVFMGYHDDSCSAIILHVCKTGIHDNDPEKIMAESKAVLLWVATPESVIRLDKSALPIDEQKQLNDMYFNIQHHDSIVDYLQHTLVEQQQQLFVQVTTHSKLLATSHKKDISMVTKIAMENIMLLDTLSSFDTEQQFSNKIQQHLQRPDSVTASLLIIQCDSGDVNANLVACARYCVMDEYQKVRDELKAPVHVVFIVQLPNVAGGCFTGFQCGVWRSVHIDDLVTGDDLPNIEVMQQNSVSNLIQNAVKGHDPMETNELNNSDMSEPMDAQHMDNNERPGETNEEAMDYMESEEQSTTAGPVLARPVLAGPARGPLDINDVIIGLQVAGKESHVAGRSLNVKELILSCTQGALSMLKDKSENSERTTRRVALVLTLFHGKELRGYDLFLQGMCSLIASLLKEKETKSYDAENWLKNEAAKSENIRKAGTFRKSCVQILESKISPILAGIIAHLDTNQNLDILEPRQLPWKQDIWLAILNQAEALQLKYSDLQSPKRQSDLQEVVVLTTGCEGQMFKASMPFSWLIKQKLEEILKTQMPEKENEEPVTVVEKIDFYVGVFEQTALGKVLANFNNSGEDDSMVEEYLLDFVCMSYKSLSNEEFELVCQSVRYLYRQMAGDLGCETLTQFMLCIHEAYRTLAPRLIYFHTMNVVWPQCSAEIVRLKAQKPDHFMFREQEFTFSTLCLLIEHLSPTKNELDQSEGRSKWLKKVHLFRPVVEKVLRLEGEDPSIYGAHSYQSIQRARCMWTRVMVMKLFLEHVCAVESEDRITVKHCMPLWKVLDDSANLKEIKTMKAIEMFLKGCNKKAIKEFLGKQERCCYCESEIDGAPIVLPCEHVFCDECYQNTISMGEYRCLKCSQPFPDDWQPERQTEKKIEKQKLADFQKRCNSFFMDVVSQLCFHDNKPPSDEVIDKLLEYITVQTKGRDSIQGRTVTKEMTIFNTGLDPNPVFRSFLLQLLMRTSEEEVVSNLEKYLRQAQILVRQTNEQASQEYVDLGLLVIQCLEDILSQELSNTVEVEQGLKFLRRAGQTIFSEKLNVEKLYGLAEARIGLAVAAKAISNIVKHGSSKTVDAGVRKLIEATETLCMNGYTDFPRIYLVKYMCRRYGMDVYQAVCQSQIRYLMWIGKLARAENERVEISDRFVLCGETYTRIREALTKVVLGEDIQHLDQTLQELWTSQSHVHVMLCLAMYREITCSVLYPQDRRKVTDKVVGVLQNFIQNSDKIKHKDLPLRCLQNALGQPLCVHLEVTPGVDFRTQGIQCLLTHFMTVISQLQQDRTILQTLVDIYGNPQMYINKYIPTMPQDDLEDVKEALLAARNNPAFSGENPVFYRCPNGHPYVIGDCGRPATVGTCKECGSTIGGEGYQLRPGNIQHQGNDETQTGHILGPAETRGQGLRPEREMTPLYCACVRLTIHLAMYLGTVNDAQAIHQIIVPSINVRDVPDYIWRHILQDLTDLQQVLGRSIDDTFVLLHAMFDHMMRNHDKGNTTREDVRGLSSKAGRREWEKAFCAQYIQPILTETDRILQQSNMKLVQDQRLGADPLLCLLYEIDTHQEQVNPNHLELIPATWRYRSPITLEHLRQEFDTRKTALGKRTKQLKVLDLFLKEEHYLRAIRCIPSILKLQRELFHKYQRKLDKAEASQITVGQIIRDKTAGEETSHLVEDFIIAWDICRDTLKQYLCPTELGGMLVQKGYCVEITGQSPISVLLPGLKDEGLCAYALLDFLLRKQNDFLDKYISETTKAKKRYMSTVQPMEVTSAHLISYDPQQDLLPIILANCQYSFEIGKGTKIEYDFRSLEHQIMDRFLFSKSKIDVGPVLKIDLMVYRTEFTNGEVFKKLEEKIPQEGLGSAVKTQISSELKTLPDLCQSLYNLDITISFLKSVGGNPADSLQIFMEETLQMSQTIVSQKARQSCQFKHVQSLWLLLALEKSKKMAEQREPVENIFESVSHEFHKDLTGDLVAEFREFMAALSVDRLSELVATLHEYILLRVAVRENRDTEDYVDTAENKLRDWLTVYSEDKDRNTLVAVLTGFPETILYKHCVNAWVESYRKLHEKQTGDRRF